MTRNRNDSAGFTLIEVATVCAIVGVLAMLAYPNMVRFQQQQQTKDGATQMAGVIEEARSRATSEATPYLVYFNDESVAPDGSCGPAATMVRDSDRTYDISAGDTVREIALPEGACEKVKRYGESDSTALPELRLPIEDLSSRGLEVLGVTGEEDEEDEEEDEETPGSSSGKGKSTSETKVADVVVNGATFPIDEVSGLPVIAFSERGIPVDPANPTSWGSGAGAIYLTDGRATVYAAVVQPLGNVQLRVFDSVTGEWR